MTSEWRCQGGQTVDWLLMTSQNQIPLRILFNVSIPKLKVHVQKEVNKFSAVPTIQTEKKTDRQIDRQRRTDERSDKQTDRQTDRKTDSLVW